jgi:hypothetical protein
LDTYDVNGGTFASIVAPMYATLTPLTKPVLIAETGALSAAQPAFLSQVAPDLKASFPFVKGFIYSDRPGGLADWQLSAAGITAFTALGHNKYLSAFAGAQPSASPIATVPPSPVSSAPIATAKPTSTPSPISSLLPIATAPPVGVTPKPTPISSRPIATPVALPMPTPVSGRPTPSPTPAPTPVGTSAPLTAPLMPPAGHAYYGASVILAGTWSEAGVENFESSIGRRLAIDHHYALWGELDVPGYSWSAEAADVALGRTPLVNINCQHYNVDVINGTYDGQIVDMATNVKAFGKPMFINYWWEMNDKSVSNNRAGCYDAAHDGPSGGVPAGFFNPTNYVAAWRHIHDIFVAQGVTNVAWVFDFDGTGGESPAQYYPGDSYVDWLGYDAYALTPDESFTATNDRGYGRATSINSTKPIMVCETGVQHTNNQQAWLSSAAATIPSHYPNIAGGSIGTHKQITTTSSLEAD